MDEDSIPCEIVLDSAPIAPSQSMFPIPPIVAQAGSAAAFAWDEFFAAGIRNLHTRTAYRRAVERFLAWCNGRELALHQIAPGNVGAYLDQLLGSIPTRKLHLAALRRFFDLLVLRHVVILNPAASVRGERYQVFEGKTPEIGAKQVSDLMRSIDTSNVIGLRDKAIIGLLIYTAVRVGAVAKLRRGDLQHDGSQHTVRFLEKCNKVREIPVRHDLEQMLLSFLKVAGLKEANDSTPFFHTTFGKTGRLTAMPMSAEDMCRMIKRRLKDAGLPTRISPHSFRAATITNLLEQGVPLEDVQYLAGHADPRTTRLYDRRQRRVTRNIVERITFDTHEVS